MEISPGETSAEMRSARVMPSTQTPSGRCTPPFAGAAAKTVMQNQPAVFLKLLVLLVPREMKLEHSGGVKAMSDEEIERSIELIKQMIAERDAAANAKVIEATAESVALPAPAELEQPQRKRPNRLLEHADTAVGPKERKPRQHKVPSPPRV